MTDEKIIKQEDKNSEDRNQITGNSELGGLEKEKKEENKGFFGRRKCRDCDKLESECAEYKAGWQRALADYKNLQNEVEKRRGEWAQMSEIQVLEDFLPVYEHLKLAISNEQLASATNPWLEGIKHVARQFADILKSHGVEEIKTVGEQLDLKFHEAVGEEESDKSAGTIIKEVETGYVMGERVVKAAKVVVAK